MPKKKLGQGAVPTLVQERLRIWGQAIRQQRTVQRMRAADLCTRMEISEATLRRLERGDPGGGAALYLTAFQVLGLLDDISPEPASALWAGSGGQRVRLPAKDGHDYF